MFNEKSVVALMKVRFNYSALFASPPADNDAVELADE